MPDFRFNNQSLDLSCTNFGFTARQFIMAIPKGKSEPWILKLSLGRISGLPREFPHSSHQLHPIPFLKPEVWQRVEKPYIGLYKFSHMRSFGYLDCPLGLRPLGESEYSRDLSRGKYSRQPCDYSTVCTTSRMYDMNYHWGRINMLFEILLKGHSLRPKDSSLFSAFKAFNTVGSDLWSSENARGYKCLISVIIINTDEPISIN